MLDAESYAGQRFTARYQTNGYYDISATESGFQIEYKPFETPVIKSFEDEFFGQWLDDPIAYGAFENGRLLGYVEGFLETQTCNENAIAFYRRYGFEIIGFDLYAYSNTDPEKNEVRVEMGRKLG